jgi:tRNA 2-thiouridine synthesizing protein A
MTRGGFDVNHPAVEQRRSARGPGNDEAGEVDHLDDKAPAPDAPGPRELDLRGLKCPLPALRTRKALAALNPGERLAVRATDPMAAIDIPHLLRETGDVLEESAAEAGVLTFVVRKAGGGD